MIKNKLKFSAGQNVRYTGKGFTGFIKKQPYMLFIAYYHDNEAMVKYNGANVIVNTSHLEHVG